MGGQMKTFDLEAAAAFLNISTYTLKGLAGSGVVAGAKVGKEWVFIDEFLEQFLRDETRRQTAERRGKPEAPEHQGSENENKPHVLTTTSRTVRRRPAPPPSLHG